MILVTWKESDRRFSEQLDIFYDSNIRSHYQEKPSTPEIKDAANPQMYHSDGLKILNLDFAIFCCGIVYYVNCSLQCQSFEVWKGLLGVQFRLQEGMAT